jgi:hypothetical protein
MQGQVAVRRATLADADALARFETENTWAGVYGWVRDLTSFRHPTTSIEDWTLAETRPGCEVVSATCAIRQEWSFEGIPLPVSRLELITTAPAYRRRGLVRQQIDIQHRLSAARDDLIQVVAGIPWFYRQFGYEPCLDLHVGRFVGAPPQGTRREDGLLSLRTAERRDVPFLARRYAAAAQRYALFCLRDETTWAYEALGHRADSGPGGYEVSVVERSGVPIGTVVVYRRLWWKRLFVLACELDGLDASATGRLTAQELLERLHALGSEYATRDNVAYEGVSFWLGEQHPVYPHLEAALEIREGGLAWYVRIPDLARFVRHVSPVLDRRLASFAVDDECYLTLSFYRGGLRLCLRGGRIAGAESWMPDRGEPPDASFPPGTFLQLLLGYRSLADLEYAFPDCVVHNEFARPLLDAAFHRRPSFVWALA